MTGTAGTPFGVLIEQSPATHASNVDVLHDVRTYQAGFPFYSTAGGIDGLFPMIMGPCDAGMCPTPTPVTNPVISSLTSVVSYYQSALAGGPITVTGLTAPVNIPNGM